MKLKNIVVPAVFGFALSFFISIVVSHSFGTALLRGLIFALVFGALSILIDYVYSKFLNDGTPMDFSAESNKADSRVGGKVDITISDAELSDDGESLNFSVANNRFKLSDVDTKSVREINEESFGKVKPSLNNTSATGNASYQESLLKSEPKEEKPAFKPVSLVSNSSVSAASGSETAKVSANTMPSAASSDNVAPVVSAKRAERVAEKKEIDALPDLDSFGEEGELDDDDVIEDSEFAQNGMDSSDEGRIVFADGSKAKDHDTETLAKAIRTVLKRED